MSQPSTPSAVRETWDQAREKTSEWTQNARKRSSEVAENAQDVVRDNPGTVLGIAALAGLAIGYLAIDAALERSNTPARRFNAFRSKSNSFLENAASAICEFRDAAEKAISRLR